MPVQFRASRALRRAVSLSAAAGALALAGCATHPVRTSAPAAAAAGALQTAHAYSGRFSVQYVDRQTGDSRNAYGNFDWNEAGSTVTLSLRTPLGQTLAIVTSSPSEAMLELPNRQPLVAGNVSTLMQNTLGFALPIDGLRYWLRPAAAPGTPATTTRDPREPSHLAQIDQDGWTIDYVAYADAPATGVRRVNLTRAEPPLAIRLVLDDQ